MSNLQWTSNNSNNNNYSVAMDLNESLVKFSNFNQNMEYNRIITDNLLNEKKSFKRGYEINMKIKEDHNNPVLFWTEGNDTTEFIMQRMQRVYSKYPVVGDYEVNPDIFDSNILKIIKFSIEDED
nr:hypothetical protein [Clostridium sp.]